MCWWLFAFKGDNLYQTSTHLCELSFCAKPCEFTTICHKHVDEIQDELAEFSTDEKLRLFAIARGEEKPADQTNRSSGKGQSIDVLSLSRSEERRVGKER